MEEEEEVIIEGDPHEVEEDPHAAATKEEEAQGEEGPNADTSRGTDTKDMYEPTRLTLPHI